MVADGALNPDLLPMAPHLDLTDLTIIRQVMGTRLHYIVDQLQTELAKHPEVVAKKWYKDRVAHQKRLERAITNLNHLIQIERGPKDA